MLLALPPVGTLFVVGLLLGLTFAPMYALSVLAGNKMPLAVRNWLGAFAWVGALVQDLLLFVGLLKSGARLPPAAAYLLLAPGLFGLLLPALAAVKAPAGERARAALGAAYAYGFPLAAVRWLLVPMLGGSQYLAAIALQTGAIYMLFHGLLRLYWPGPAEGVSAGPLVNRHFVPERVAGIVERTARARVRPYATTPQGERNRQAISVACAPAQADSLVAKLQAALVETGFAAAPGATVDGQVEVVICARD
ncbi:MAG TPA: hypothetical protein VGK74_20830 [Symbiobacteriaceae bacterium]|jgi:hypothetical protein